MSAHNTSPGVVGANGNLQGLPAGDPWVCSPRATKNNVVLLVEEVGSVARVQ